MLSLSVRLLSISSIVLPYFIIRSFGPMFSYLNITIPILLSLTLCCLLAIRKHTIFKII